MLSIYMFDSIYFYSAKNYTDEQFFALESTVIVTLLANHQNDIVDFILKWGYEKGKIESNRMNVSVEDMEVVYVDTFDPTLNPEPLPNNPPTHIIS